MGPDKGKKLTTTKPSNDLDKLRQQVASHSAGGAHMQRHACRTGQAVAYTWRKPTGSLCAIGWTGKSQTPWKGCAYRFSTEQARREYVAQIFAAATAAAESTARRRTERATQRAAGHPLKVGDVLQAVWGYEQTNVDYYEITRLAGPTQVEYRRIGCQREETASMQGQSVPSPGQYIGEAKRARVCDWGDRDSIRVGSSGHHAKRMQPVAHVGTVRVYAASNWTAYG